MESSFMSLIIGEKLGFSLARMRGRFPSQYLLVEFDSFYFLVTGWWLVGWLERD